MTDSHTLESSGNHGRGGVSLLPSEAGCAVDDRFACRDATGIEDDAAADGGFAERAFTSDASMPAGIGYLEKPFTVETLMRRLREVLDARP